MSFVLSQKSKDKLQGVDIRLVRLVEQAIKETTVDFTVLEGLRTPERQQQLVNDGINDQQAWL